MYEESLRDMVRLLMVVRWTKHEMQLHPPDILITNYTMLSIMMSRNFEKI